MDGRKSWHFWAHLPLTPVHIWAVLRRGLASFTGEATEESWLFPVEGIHVVGAGITQHHDRVIRSRRKPSIVVTHQGNTFRLMAFSNLRSLKWSRLTEPSPLESAKYSYWPSRVNSNQPMLLLSASIHFWVWKSNNMSFVEFLLIAGT